MERKILYRIKYRNEKWYYGFPISQIKDDSVGFTSDNTIKDNDYYDIFADAKTLCEYTNLTDSNNTPIFENDILQLDDDKLNIHWTAIVEFGNPNCEYVWGWNLRPLTSNVEKYGYNTDILCWVEMEDGGVTCKIIGNKFDNPELLKGENKDE